MYHYALFAYIVLYTIIGVGLFLSYVLFIPDELKKNDKPWECLIDLGLTLTGLAGMLFLYLHIEPRWLKLAWCPISIALAIIETWRNLKDRISWQLSPEADASKDVAKATDLTVLLFLAPSLVLNVLYAFR